MQAIIATGGKQYHVTPGQLLAVEKLPGLKGSSVEFGTVLLVDRDGDLISGSQALGGARVLAEIVRQGRGRKVSVVKFKRRKNYRRKRGHRQPATTVRITRIEV